MTGEATKIGFFQTKLYEVSIESKFLIKASLGVKLPSGTVFAAYEEKFKLQNLKQAITYILKALLLR